MIERPPLSPLMKRILEVMPPGVAMTANEIGYKLDLPRVEARGRGNGRGSGHRVFGPAQRIIFPLTALRKRGLICFTSRNDGLSGTAYMRVVDWGAEYNKVCETKGY